MSIKCRRTGGFDFVFREKLLKLLPFLGPLAVEIIKDLRHRSPADVFDQFGLFLCRGWPALGLDGSQRTDSGKVLLKLRLRSTVTEFVCLSDAISIRVFWRPLSVRKDVAVR